MATTAETSRVVERHWQALVRGDVAGLMADYAEDAVLITGVTGISTGRAAIGELLTMFVTAIIPAANTRFTLTLNHASGALGYIVWQAESATHRIAFSSDTFVVADDKIIMQTSAGSIETK